MALTETTQDVPRPQGGDALDKREFRRALGHFATGVTVITAVTPGGEHIGVTANSFNSVSLDPPMVLWSLARSSGGFDLFMTAEHFCVNVLAADQVELSNHFAARQRDKFRELNWQPGAGGVPLLQGCAAQFQCRTAFRYEGGDHVIIVGEVLRFQQSGKPGLVYHHGRYAVTDLHPFHAEDEEPEASAASGFVDDYLDYLLAAAAHQFREQFQATLDRFGRGRYEWRVMAVLSDWPRATFDVIRRKTLIDAGSLRKLLGEMEAADLLSSQAWGHDEEFFLTDSGGRVVLQLLAAAKAHESDSLSQLSPQEVADLKAALKKLSGRPE